MIVAMADRKLAACRATAWVRMGENGRGVGSEEDTMTGPTSETGDRSTRPAAAPAGRGSTAARQDGAITPAAALARHIEWLEFALAAARSEESWRAGRLEKATKKNRERRTTRLAEVRDEIAELAALVAAIHGLQPRRGRPPGSKSRTPRAAGTRKRAAATPRRRASATPAAGAAPASTADATTAAADSAATMPASARTTTTRRRPAAKPGPKPGTKRTSTAGSTPRRTRRTGGTVTEGPA
jgi:hypothetical protein